MSLINGVVIGIVTKVNGKGMVKVKFPWLPDDPETDWVRIATTMAGSDRGTFFMPEETDEVLVAFEHGDTNHPYVVGFLWNGKDKPPEKDKNIRRIKTKSGHTIEFNDNPGQEDIIIKSQGGQVVELNDALGSIKAKTKSGNNTIEIIDTGIINISTKTGIINIDCINATITAKAALSLLAPIVTISGVLQVPTIVAGSGQFGAVVSGAYNPGVPGNIFGL